MYKLTKIMDRATYTDTNAALKVKDATYYIGLPFRYVGYKGNQITASKVIEWKKDLTGTVTITTDLGLFTLTPFC